MNCTTGSKPPSWRLWGPAVNDYEDVALILPTVAHRVRQHRKSGVADLGLEHTSPLTAFYKLRITWMATASRHADESHRLRWCASCDPRDGSDRALDAGGI
jgi:hypothetical protein